MARLLHLIMSTKLHICIFIMYNNGCNWSKAARMAVKMNAVKIRNKLIAINLCNSTQSIFVLSVKKSRVKFLLNEYTFAGDYLLEHIVDHTWLPIINVLVACVNVINWQKHMSIAISNFFQLFSSTEMMFRFSEIYIALLYYFMLHQTSNLYQLSVLS